MNAIIQLTLIAAWLTALIGVMLAVDRLGKRHVWPMELKRKSVHVASGLCALSFPVVFEDTWPVAVLSAAAMMVLLVCRLSRRAASGFGAALRIDRPSHGEWLFALSVGALFMFSKGDAVLFVLPIAMVTLADATAALVGKRYGRHPLVIGAGTKTIEGVASFFGVTLVLGMVLLPALTELAWVNIILLSFGLAALGSSVEASSWNGLDNLTVPAAAHVYLAGHLTGTSLDLLLAGCGFLATLIVVIALASHITLPRSAVDPASAGKPHLGVSSDGR